jgi:hypothetical protein
MSPASSSRSACTWPKLALRREPFHRSHYTQSEGRCQVEAYVHDEPPRYGACLLRYWEVKSDRPGRPSSWRFSLEAAGTGERRGFHDLEALLAYLARELAQEATGTTGAAGRVAMDE